MRPVPSAELSPRRATYLAGLARFFSACQPSSHASQDQPAPRPAARRESRIVTGRDDAWDDLTDCEIVGR